MRNSHVSRRSFLNALGMTAAAATVPGFAYAEHRRVALVAVADGIHTMEPLGSGWRSRGYVDAEAPQAMALSADKKMLYVANATDRYKTLPTGGVTSYRVSAVGALRKVGSGQLALSAVRPYALALSPDGGLLAAASEGGVVSVLAMQASGHPGPVIAAYKTLTTEPIGLTFDTDGHLHMSYGSTERRFRVSAADGFTFVSSRRLAPVAQASLDSYGVAHAKAAVCLHA